MYFGTVDGFVDVVNVGSVDTKSEYLWYLDLEQFEIVGIYRRWDRLRWLMM